MCGKEGKVAMFLRIAALSLPVAALLLQSNGLASQLAPRSRMAIIRELTAEYAGVKTPLPRGEKGLLLNVSGEIDQDDLVKEITKNGTAIAPNVLVQITAIAFRDKEIVFEINGGGKRKTKWYEHIEVGLGTRTTPLSTGQDAKTPTGSMITLVFPQKLADLSSEQLKQYLAPVLDFNPETPIPMIARPIPPQFKEAIEARQAVVGMDRDMVMAALGHPDRKVREMKAGVEQEDWIYGTPPMKVLFVSFEGDEVVEVREYVGGVRGQMGQPYPVESPR